jgi:single-strand DNA-binding protein
MASLNTVFLMGNLTRDPEVRYTGGGQAVANLGLACNRVYNTKSGEKKEEVCYVRIVVWGKQAENCGQYLSKGSAIFVEGRLQSRSWEANDGQKRSALEVVALRVQFLGKAGRGAGAKADAPDSQESPDEGPPDDFDRHQNVPPAAQAAAGEDEIPF